ncbi:MAG: helix-turn-helix transcriptional regulator [Firmicutes bacterium]|nr:helix-turn-helix transcriptional regulator [Bacillota bacterium]
MRHLTLRGMTAMSGLRGMTLVMTGVFLVQQHQLFSHWPNALMLAGYLGVVVVATVLWWQRPSRRMGCQSVLWVADAVIITILFLIFSTPHSSAPALLPVLAYEAELYWPRRGALLGGWMAGIIFLLVWWIRLWAHQPTFSPTTLLFWITVLSVLIIFPLYVVPLSSIDQSAGLPPDASESATALQVPSLSVDSPWSILSARERDIWPWLLSKASFRDIAAQLTIDMGTVKTHASRIYHKCRVRDREELRQRYAPQNPEHG